MEILGMSTEDIRQYARIMAETLAMMHWIAEIDGNDIEFVLAPPDRSHAGYPFSDKNEQGFSKIGLQIESQLLHTHRMWVLDFDLCRDMAMDLKGVEQAAIAFWRNDPYYPRPDKVLENDRSPWAIFREHYIQPSEIYIGIVVEEPLEVERRGALSKQFIELVEQGNKDP
ncbi:Protein of unknown function DUF3669 zinc finger protein [Penicillium capsulatum]|uniref:DUF3669 domain-containing protein n=1 Tax=Penicillium capsulatum TaxID=69766 RepID=A0A9W9IS89_9EURO|nr:Protein of unknown function DUF3669 zinc finger protein [Penicillium capsulatum]KAJ6121361.1 zinc finger protein [Penicillium capsulatum]